MVQNMSSRAVDGFLPLNYIYTSKVKRNSTLESTNYYCFNGEFPLSIGAAKIYNNESNSSLACRKEWISDNKDIFLLKHHIQNNPFGHTSSPYSLTTLESNLKEKLNAGTTIHISHVSELYNPSSTDQDTTLKSECDADLHAALDCLAELDATGIVRRSDVNAYSIRSNYTALDTTEASFTISGVKYHHVILLMTDQKMNATDLDSILCESAIVNALSHKEYTINEPLSIYIVSGGPDVQNIPDTRHEIKENVLTILKALVA